MPSYPKNYPFYGWMPKPLGIIILLFFFLPILTVGGVYSVNSTEMMSGLGIISEHIQFANFVTSIGMAAFAPFLYQLVCVRREKMMCIVGFAFMYIFSYICAKTDSVFLLALCSLLTGFLRMVLMMVNLFTLIWYAGGMEATRNITPGLEPKDTVGWNKLDIERCVSQPAVYLFFMILGQSGTALTAWLSFEYEWKYVYYFMMGILLISILLLFITMPNYKFPGRFPINFRKFGNVTAFCISLTCLTYVLVYGKVLDWYDDESIRWATAVSILFAGIFLYMDVTRRSPYVLLDAFKLRTIRMGALLYLLLMVINSSAMFVNVFAGVGMHLDNLQNASLGNWCMVGYAIGAVVAMVLGGKGLHFKYLFAMGFFFLSLSAVFMYFEVQTAGVYERLKYAVYLLAQTDREILDICEVKPVVLQTEVHPYYQEKKLKDYLKKEGIVIQAWYPLGHGDKALLEEPLFQELGKKYGKSSAQIILRWHIQAGNIVIPGSKSPAHIQDNFDLFDFSLTAWEMAQISIMDKNVRYYTSTPELLQRYAAMVPSVDEQK